MKISGASIKIILDSRGKDTLEAELKGNDFSVKASVPAGKSTGAHEAYVLEPKKALEKLKEIKSLIFSRDFERQDDFDNFLIEFDGIPNKRNLGGNLILSLSLAFARLKAKNEGLELFQYIRNEFSDQLRIKFANICEKISDELEKIPAPIFNVINGGAHATHPESRLNFQEFQIIPMVNDFGIAFSLGREFYKKLKEFLDKKFGKENIVLGDEAGYCAPFKSNEEAIEVIAEVIEKYKHPLRIGLDVAASQFFKGDYYLIAGEKYSAEELKELYLKLIETYNILSIEDPFNEESFNDFTALSHRIAAENFLIIADDLTATNPERLRIAIEKKSGNAILIKPNQIGTLTETLKVVELAYQNNWQTVVSHRSGETMDDFIADLAVGIGAWGIKAGAPAKPERLAKYERILKIATSY